MVEEDDEFAHHGGERDFLDLVSLAKLFGCVILPFALAWLVTSMNDAETVGSISLAGHAIAQDREAMKPFEIGAVGQWVTEERLKA